jgi:hypothetical protein
MSRLAIKVSFAIELLVVVLYSKKVIRSSYTSRIQSLLAVFAEMGRENTTATSQPHNDLQFSAVLTPAIYGGVPTG